MSLKRKFTAYIISGSFRAFTTLRTFEKAHQLKLCMSFSHFYIQWPEMVHILHYYTSVDFQCFTFSDNFLLSLPKFITQISVLSTSYKPGSLLWSESVFGGMINIIYIYIYAFSKHFYPKRNPKESYTKMQRSLIKTTRYPQTLRVAKTWSIHCEN